MIMRQPSLDHDTPRPLQTRRSFLGSAAAVVALSQTAPLSALAATPSKGANPLDEIKMVPGKGEKFGGLPAPLGKGGGAPTVQPWSGFDPPCTLEDQQNCKNVPSLTYNEKPASAYDDIQVEASRWVAMACEQATDNVHQGGRPFGAVMVQVDDQTNEVLRYWPASAHVYAWNDPTAHAEVTAIRAACRDLGVGNLGKIEKKDAKLPQTGATSHCVLFSSTESCPMCQAAEYWAGLETVVFGATQYDAAQQGVGINQAPLFKELSLPYRERKTTIRQSSVPNSLDAYNLLKRSRKKS